VTAGPLLPWPGPARLLIRTQARHTARGPHPEPACGSYSAPEPALGQSPQL